MADPIIALTVGAQPEVPTIETPEQARKMFGPEVRYPDGTVASLTAAVIDCMISQKVGVVVKVRW